MYQKVFGTEWTGSRWDSVLERNSSWTEPSSGKVELKRSKSVLMRERHWWASKAIFQAIPLNSGRQSESNTKDPTGGPERSASVLGSQADKRRVLLIVLLSPSLKKEIPFWILCAWLLRSSDLSYVSALRRKKWKCLQLSVSGWTC